MSIAPPNGSDLESLYAEHLDDYLARFDKVCEETGTDGVVIHAGSLKTAFLDDKTYPFIVNPHFNSLVPVTDNPDCFVVLRSGETPRLLFHQPADYWHKPATLPNDFWTARWDIHPIPSARDASNLVGDPTRLQFIGEDTALAHEWGFHLANDERALAQLHWQRGAKTRYEVECITAATAAASRGHLAAAAAFAEGQSEFEIQHRYLAATGHRETETPYTSIVGMNENCGVLHYQHYEHAPPSPVRSMLIDAGASCRGYASDITRTYAQNQGLFADLVNAMDEAQQAIIDDIEPRMVYSDLHDRMQHRLATVLVDFKLVSMSADAMVETDIPFTFMPHGLGHFLGLQTHDVGGHQQSASGGTTPPPDNAPALRLTRTIDDGQVFTIEPGLYFIPLLLDKLRDGKHQSDVNWTLIESLLPCGGIRIEDNVHIRDGSVINLTRPYLP